MHTCVVCGCAIVPGTTNPPPCLRAPPRASGSNPRSPIGLPVDYEREGYFRGLSITSAPLSPWAAGINDLRHSLPTPLLGRPGIRRALSTEWTRYAVEVEYDGGAFGGWARQADVPTVQGALEAALDSFAGGARHRGVVGSSRTDSGVHAERNVCHVDLARPFEAETVARALNAGLRRRRELVGSHRAAARSAVRVRRVALAPARQWHARFCATAREYTYLLSDARSSLSPTLDKPAWHVAGAADAPSRAVFSHDAAVVGALRTDAMAEAAAALVGTRDFSAVRAARCSASSPVCSVSHAAVRRLPVGEGGAVAVTMRGSSFVYRMVRGVVGLLAAVGGGKLPVASVEELLERGDRASAARAAPTAPAHGLRLTAVEYARCAERCAPAGRCVLVSAVERMGDDATSPLFYDRRGSGGDAQENMRELLRGEVRVRQRKSHCPDGG